MNTKYLEVERIENGFLLHRIKENGERINTQFIKDMEAFYDEAGSVFRGLVPPEVVNIFTNAQFRSSCSRNTESRT